MFRRNVPVTVMVRLVALHQTTHEAPTWMDPAVKEAAARLTCIGLASWRFRPQHQSTNWKGFRQQTIGGEQPTRCQLLLRVAHIAKGRNFESLVARYYQPLYLFAFSLTRHEADAGDLTQQTFCIWAAKGHQLRDESKVKTWLFTTLHREFLMARRKQDRFPHVELEQVATELPAVPPPLLYRPDTARVLAALVRLDEIYRSPVVLYYLEDYSYIEIAKILGVPIGTVKSRLARGLDRLHQLLKGGIATGSPSCQPGLDMHLR